MDDTDEVINIGFQDAIDLARSLLYLSYDPKKIINGIFFNVHFGGERCDDGLQTRNCLN